MEKDLAARGIYQEGYPVESGQYADWKIKKYYFIRETYYRQLKKNRAV